MIVKILGELALVGAIASVFIVAAQGWAQERAAEEASGRDYMRTLDDVTLKLKNKYSVASWNYEANLTQYNQENFLQVSLEIAEEEKEYWIETMTYLWHEFEDEDLKRMFRRYSVLGTSALPEDLNKRLIKATNNMRDNYATATICDYHDKRKCDLHVEPEVTDIFAKSEDAEELKHAWVEWHNSAGKVSKGNFTEYVQMYNEAARLNGFTSVAEWWLAEYDTAKIEDEFLELWNEIKPLYQQLHAFVRRKLRLKYGEDVVSARGPIPAHLVGNIWAQSWINLEKYTVPFPNKVAVDVTAALNEQNYTALKFFETADKFFTSLGLMPVTKLFWENSILQKPDDGRDLICHASAWDFFDGDDFRIRQCTTITNDFFTTTHHEMGHIQYYMQYQDLPYIFRSGANPGFHEAVGDVIALSVATPKHLKLMGLLDKSFVEDEESTINQLFKVGLQKIIFLPYGYLLDVYRYSIFRGETSFMDYNCHFWKLREAVQGIEPPVRRSEDDFDAAAKYHVSADVEYMRYYVSYIIQFQFHQKLCELAGQYKPNDPSKLLVNCDIYGSQDAGEALAKMLQMGSSKPWPDAMEAITGQRKMSASGMMEYFQPLYEWLKKENAKTGEYIGWEHSNVEFCTPLQENEIAETEFGKLLKQYMDV